MSWFSTRSMIRMAMSTPWEAPTRDDTLTLASMMVGLRPEEARDFYEEDEDPARVFALFDAAEKGRSAPPRRRASQKTDLTPLRQLMCELGTQLRQDLRKVRLRDRVVLAVQRLADKIGQTLGSR